ncbi:unnamed protein product [Nesidiocoris tenuis]|uniref:Ig-like domain-containing protein n=1 Tax=Nesidiocoris tenuis TaxID=355587 RepID=A0A6H5FVK2_9HEMI|nr:unnamed protein product [Nesidiocoris tenuis]
MIHGSELRIHVKTSRIPVGQAFENHDVLQKRPNPLFHEFQSRPSPNPRELQNSVVLLQTRPSPKCQISQKSYFTKKLPSKYEVDENKTVVLECETSHTVSTTWYHDKKELSGMDNRELVQEGRTQRLVIKKASRKDKGTYACAVKDQTTETKLIVHANGAKRKLVIKKVTLEDQTDITCMAMNIKTTSKLKIEEVPSLKIDDEAISQRLELRSQWKPTVEVSGYPTPEIAWAKDGTKLVTDKRVTTFVDEKSTTIAIYSTDRKDSGTYTVTATNIAGSTTLDLKLKVIAPPSPPNSIAVLNIASKSVTLQWEPPLSNGGSELTAVPSPPTAPLEMRSTGANSVMVSWGVPESDGGAPIEGYKIAVRDIKKTMWMEVGRVGADIQKLTIKDLQCIKRCDFGRRRTSKTDDSSPRCVRDACKQSIFGTEATAPSFGRSRSPF